MFRLLMCVWLLLSISVRAQDGNELIAQKIAPTFYSSVLEKKGFKEKDSVTLLVSLKDLNSDISSELFKTINIYPQAKLLLLKTSYKSLEQIVADTNVIFINQLRVPKEELTTGAVDFTLNNITYLRSVYPDLNGDSVILSIKEQKFDFNDIDFKGRIVSSPLAANTNSSHASIMATIAAGGGNTSPFAKGVAWGSNINSSDFSVLLPDADIVYRNAGITVQNHSYGTSIENFYGGDAVAYDMSVWNNKQLVHVFSAGNSGTSASASGAYNGITGFANLSGSFKMAKNIITVGHLDSFYSVLPLSSKGPAYDGRVKPELVAYGEDGSSGAAAMVSGTVAVLQQVYKQIHHQYPSAELIKAVLLNGADDIGNTGPDYISGYGSLNAYKATEIIKKNNFFENAVSNTQVKNFSISIPQNSAQVKITIAWTDTAAAVNTPKSLINNLDVLLINNATNETWLPWILNTKPNKDSLLLPAMRGKDTLNNVEQITIENPLAGDYIIQVKGTSIATSNQPFAIAYQVDTTNNFQWTYPSAKDALFAAKVNVLRWQSNIVGNGSLEYSYNGTNWQSIAANADLSKQYFKWNIPDTVSLVQLRMNTAIQTFYSDTFTISKPIAIKVGFNCADSFLLFWNKAGVNHYRLYELGDKYMQAFSAVSDTSVIINKAQHSSVNYSVVPVVNNKEGQRSFTINYTTTGVECYLHNFTASLINNSGILIADLGTIYNVASIAFQKINVGDTQILRLFNHPASISFSYADVSLSRGANNYRLVVTLNNGTVLYSNIERIYFFSDLPVIVFPNPARQNMPINILSRDPFVYSIHVFDVTGRLINKQNLQDITNQIPPLILSKGLYFIKITTEGGVIITQKLIVQ